MLHIASRIPMSHSRQSPIRLLTATALYDGHDAAINIIRRLLQAQGAEVIHLGHSCSVEAIVRAALQEDADAVAISSYQGGHMEFFNYLRECLVAEDAGTIQVFGGGGGTITAAEAAELEAGGVEKIYTAEDGLQLGLLTMVQDLLGRIRPRTPGPESSIPTQPGDQRSIARCLSAIENAKPLLPRQNPSGLQVALGTRRGAGAMMGCPVIGITGTGGSGKSSLIDELLQQFLQTFPQLRIALLAIDPTRHRSGGALLGDRIRINALADPRVFMRSMATRRRHLATNTVLGDCLALLRQVGFGLILVETAGVGQADAEIVDWVDHSLYVMTPDYGAPGQLEKIEMLDQADLICLNKYDQAGAEDALRDIRRQWRHNHQDFSVPGSGLPVYPTIASRFDDSGVARLFSGLCARLATRPDPAASHWASGVQSAARRVLEDISDPSLIPPQRDHYLAEIAAQGQTAERRIAASAAAASQAQAGYMSLQALADPHLPVPLDRYPETRLNEGPDVTLLRLRQSYNRALDGIGAEGLALLRDWLADMEKTAVLPAGSPERDNEVPPYVSPSHLPIPQVARPDYRDWGSLLGFLLRENLPGHYPYTAGTFPYRRASEDPARMFAGEGGPERTNCRFHYLSRGQKSTRLSTAFDPLVLYGADPDPRPDVYGRVGMSGVSVASLDDLKILYSGFDLCAADTSVSMTINGPAPILLAWFMNAAIDQQVEKYLHVSGSWRQTRERLEGLFRDRPRPVYRGALPPGHDGLGLGLLGISGAQVIERESYERIRADTLARVRGTVQADILKEDQAQNECLFDIGFALRLMGDVQEYFITQGVKHYYSVSVSGYHIAEAGANPVTQLAFTLANGFTLVEYYLARGMAVDDFAPHMSFFFSNGMDPEYAVIGRVARRIWARAMRDIYHAGARSQRLKYHIQTSGRSLHTRAIGFNEIRTTLQALYALNDRCNSLHTNAYDEAVTTPTAASARRALAIQMIINRELGLSANENPWQGSFLIETLTREVEAAVYQEFGRLDRRGGVLGAMETQYQRNRIQEESLEYERRKHEGSAPIVGVNTFVSTAGADRCTAEPELSRADDAERDARIEALRRFKYAHRQEVPVALQRLREAVRGQRNTFAELMRAAPVCSLGQMVGALHRVGGRYRRRL